MPRIIWPKTLEVAQPELLPFAHSFQTLPLDIKPDSFLGGECFWTEPFTSGSLAEIWPWLVVTENHYQLMATWGNEMVSLIPVPNGHISANTVTTGTNWHSQLRDHKTEQRRKLNLPLHPLPAFLKHYGQVFYTTIVSQAGFTLNGFSKLCHFCAAWFSTAWLAIPI